MKPLIIASLVALTGCGTLSKAFTSGFTGLPSVQHCQRVSYLRDNGKITIQADCLLPSDPGGLGLASIIK